MKFPLEELVLAFLCPATVRSREESTFSFSVTSSKVLEDSSKGVAWFLREVVPCHLSEISLWLWAPSVNCLEWSQCSELHKDIANLFHFVKVRIENARYACKWRALSPHILLRTESQSKSASFKVQVCITILKEVGIWITPLSEVWNPNVSCK